KDLKQIIKCQQCGVGDLDQDQKPTHLDNMKENLLKALLDNKEVDSDSSQESDIGTAI
ncbi:15942_t:CDS:2, partial [Gigaspora margarita]